MNNKKFVFIPSFEDASILRKFSILFLIMSIVPMGILYYIYMENNGKPDRGLVLGNFTLVMILMGLGVLVGYLSMRSLLVKIIDITKKNNRALSNVLGSDMIQEINQGENEVVILNRSFSAVIQKLEGNAQSLQLAQKTLHDVMVKISQAISNMENINSFLALIVETITNALNGQVGTIWLLNDKKSELMINTVYGVVYDSRQSGHLRLFDSSPLMRVIQEKRPMIVSGIFLQNDHDPQLSRIFSEKLLCAPLVYQDKVIGIMTLKRNEGVDENFVEEEIAVFFRLASQVAVAIENSKFNRDIERIYFEAVAALALAVDARDPYAIGHLDRVSHYASLIGQRLGLDEQDMNTLKEAARLHDIGKIGIADHVLRKKSVFTDEEWVIMRRHPEIGESIIKPVRSLEPLRDLIRHHHERLDGTGYPDGLKAEEINPLVRILSIADAYDAITTRKFYNEARTKQEALAILRLSGNQFDQEIVEILAEELNRVL